MMKRTGVIAAAAMLYSGIASAAIEIEWWHAMGGRLGDHIRLAVDPSAIRLFDPENSRAL